MKSTPRAARSRPPRRVAVRRSCAGLCAAALIAAATACAAQIPSPPRADEPPGAPPRAGFEPASLPPPPLSPAASDTLVSGTLSRLTINPEGAVDGFVLTDGTLVGVPPHLGTQLIALARPGDRVTVAGERRVGDDIHARVVRNDRSGASLSDQPPPSAAPMRPRCAASIWPASACRVSCGASRAHRAASRTA
ncbi:hypothetical protein CSX04_07455 [Burkholderia cepacia]|nr:hypothetical protein CSX04_07455 [Burkholderia cepacia]